MKLREFDPKKEGSGWDLYGNKAEGRPALCGNFEVECPADAVGFALVDDDGLSLHFLDEAGEDVFGPHLLGKDYWEGLLIAENLGETFYIRPDWDLPEDEFYGTGEFAEEQFHGYLPGGKGRKEEA